MKIRAEMRLILVADLHEAETNAKKHTDEQIDILARGIERFGFNVPLVVANDNEIIAGHGRLYAAKKLGLTEVPCIVADNLTHDEIEAYRLADNQINAMTGFDMPMVIEGLKYLDAQSFDISLTGFSADLLIESDAKDDEIPENPPPLAQIGDLWALGPHRVLCGDSTKKKDVERLMADKRADMVLTDPPYNVDYVGKTKKALKIEGDHRDDDGFLQFLTDAFSNMNASLKPGGGSSMFGMPIVKVTRSAQHAELSDGSCGNAWYGTRAAWSWEGRTTTGNTNHAFMGGRTARRICGLPTAHRPLCSTSTSHREASNTLR